MAEASKVRLVRCPKCENLLPELPDFSLYQCGGCGAVLRGKKKGILEDSLLEPSDNLKVTGETGEGSVSNSSGVEMQTSSGIESVRAERIRNERVVPDRTSTSRPRSKELQADSEMGRRGKQRVGRLEQFDDEYVPYQRGPLHYQNQEKVSDSNVDRPEFANFHAVKETRTPPAEPLRSRPVMDQWGPASNGSQVPYVSTRGRYDNFSYHDEGPSSYDVNPYYEHGGRTRYPSHNLNGIDSIENLESGRAELLRKLDELKDQLSHSCEVGGKPKEKAGIDPYGRHHSPYVQDGLNRSQGLNKKPLSPDELEAHYLSQAPGFNPYRDRYGTSMPEPYPQRGYPHEFAGYADRPDMHWRPPHEPPSHYMRGPYREHYPGYYEDVSHDHAMLHRHENLFHQPACSCVHCYNKHLHMAPSPKIDPSVYHDRRSRNEPSHPDFHYGLNHTPHGPQSYSSGGSTVHPVHSRQSLIHSLSDQDTERDGGNSYHRPRKVGTPHKSGKTLYPIAGGAPFVTCSSCFELLKLPRKHVSLAKSEHKMKCGACSSVIIFELGNDGYVVSASVRVEEVVTEIDDGSSGTGDETARYWHGGPNSADMNALPNDYEDFRPKLTPTDHKSNSVDPEKKMDPLSRASSLSEAERSPINVPSEEHGSPPAILDSVLVKSFPQNESSVQEFLDHSSDNSVASRSENGSKSRRSEQGRLSRDKSTSRQSSVKDAAVATEMDMSMNEFPNSCVSQDSVDASKEDMPRANKGGDSFLAGFIKKSFKKPNQNVEGGGGEVYVNGHLIPDRLIKKAEKLAGPIQPGDYWYDSQAGFWGVMGYPCLGIVMPNIEEFNYRMPEHCAAGNTAVFVNGRELHQKDLDLLSSRGLPITRHRSYTVEITGKVVDDQTGEELDGLGKLAPTVEKAKHGFGMKVPRSIAQG